MGKLSAECEMPRYYLHRTFLSLVMIARQSSVDVRTGHVQDAPVNPGEVCRDSECI